MKNMFKFLGLLIFFTASSCTDSEKIVFIDGEKQIEEPVNSEFPTAKEVILDMSSGFNLGNTFENGINSTTFVSIKPIVDLYKNAGMKHMRIPITWMDRFGDKLADENGNVNVNHPRFLELVQTIDYAISLDMYVVLNTHHEHWLKDNYDGTSAYDTKFQTLWTGIATYFKNYPGKLIFEVLNEPEGTLGENDGNGPFPDASNPLAISYTRKVNQVGYDAIRATGGNNATRIIMVGVNGQGNAVNLEEVYPNKASLPGGGKDYYMAIQVHSYNPWAFCGETGSNAAFPGTATVEKGIQDVSVHSIKLNVPINYGEFGVGRSSNTAERNTDLVRGFYKTMAVSILGQKMSYSVWDDRGWFALINNSGTSFTNNIVPYMLE
ncbi:MAG: glycoside hydrolase [Flavobacteriales bacterium 32-34-25]|nr:MAG: glycoside hydrolase [Flavobacteriales bacterium 32-34-25]